jgi:hypothetical protein
MVEDDMRYRNHLFMSRKNSILVTQRTPYKTTFVQLFPRLNYHRRRKAGRQESLVFKEAGCITDGQNPDGCCYFPTSS